jgi:hypothetical protein
MEDLLPIPTHTNCEFQAPKDKGSRRESGGPMELVMESNKATNPFMHP